MCVRFCHHRHHHLGLLLGVLLLLYIETHSHPSIHTRERNCFLFVSTSEKHWLRYFAGGPKSTCLCLGAGCIVAEIVSAYLPLALLLRIARFGSTVHDNLVSFQTGQRHSLTPVSLPIIYLPYSSTHSFFFLRSSSEHSTIYSSDYKQDAPQPTNNPSTPPPPHLLITSPSPPSPSHQTSPILHSPHPRPFNLTTTRKPLSTPSPPFTFPNSQKRSLHLAPPFLHDTYTPRYILLSEPDCAKKRSQAYAHLAKCNLCPRKCGVNRLEGKTGWCLIGERAKVNVIAPHFGEGE